MKVKLKCLFQVRAYVPQGLVCCHKVWIQSNKKKAFVAWHDLHHMTLTSDLKTLQPERHPPQVLVLR